MNIIDLYVVEEMKVKCEVNRVLLNSLVGVARSCDSTRTDSLIPPTVFKLPNENKNEFFLRKYFNSKHKIK